MPSEFIFLKLLWHNMSKLSVVLQWQHKSSVFIVHLTSFCSPPSLEVSRSKRQGWGVLALLYDPNMFSHPIWFPTPCQVGRSKKKKKRLSWLGSLIWSKPCLLHLPSPTEAGRSKRHGSSWFRQASLVFLLASPIPMEAVRSKRYLACSAMPFTYSKSSGIRTSKCLLNSINSCFWVVGSQMEAGLSSSHLN